MTKEIQIHQIEELLLNAHLESEGGIDLIEEYFDRNASLDRITSHALNLLQKETDQKVRDAILKNLSECIVVKAQRVNRSLFGTVRKCLKKIGLATRKDPEILRAEKLIDRF